MANPKIPTYAQPIVDEDKRTSRPWYFFLQGLSNGLTVKITTAKLTGGGTNGSMTFTNGILTSQTPAT